MSNVCKYALRVYTFLRVHRIVAHRTKMMIIIILIAKNKIEKKHARNDANKHKY